MILPVRKNLPTPGDVHVNAPLTNMSLLYANADTAFVADKASPIITSQKQSDLFFKFTKDYWFRDSLRKRGPGAEAAELGYGVSTDSFAIDVWAGKKPIADQTRANEDAPLNGDRNATHFVTALERLRREISFADTFLQAATWTTDYDGVASDSPSTNEVNRWDRANSTPVKDIKDLCTKVHLLTGVRPNTLVMGQEVWDKLSENASIIDRIKAGGAPGAPTPTVASREKVAELMEINEILVMGGVKNTAAEGATFVGAFVGGKDALLYYKAPNPGIEVVSALYTFTWQQYAANANGTRIKKYRNEDKASDMVEIESAFVHKIVAADAGAFIDDVIG